MNQTDQIREILPAEATRALRWSQERRLQFIDFRLQWGGKLNRADLTLLQAQASGFTPRSSEPPDDKIVCGAKKTPNFSAIRQSVSSTEISGNSPSLMGVRKVGVLLNESAQADAVGYGRPAEGIPAINGGEDVKPCAP